METHTKISHQRNARRLHVKRARGLLYVHKCVKVVVRVREISFFTKQMTVGVSSDNSSEGIRYMDLNSKVLWKFYNSELQPLVSERTRVAERIIECMWPTTRID